MPCARWLRERAPSPHPGVLVLCGVQPTEVWRQPRLNRVQGERRTHIRADRPAGCCWSCLGLSGCRAAVTTQATGLLQYSYSDD